ncbi:MAG: UDP-N-acetylmuramoyl-L-alanine--D-glutamate ligase [Actinomycetota bacterium]
MNVPEDAGDWSGLGVVVTGLGVSGRAAAEVLLQRGAHVRVVDSRDGAQQQVYADVLRDAGAQVDLGEEAVRFPTDSNPDLVVTSPGWQPNHPFFRYASAAGVPIWGEVELAWRLRSAGAGPRWLTLTGTNGKTTAVRMLQAILHAAGYRSAAVGNVGEPVVSAVLAKDPHDFLAVELSSFQLHWLAPDRVLSLSSWASAVLNIAPDHLDWHGSYEEYAHAKGEIYQRTQVACIYNVQDRQTEKLARVAQVAPNCRMVGFSVQAPQPGMIGVADDMLVDCAFVDDPSQGGVELAAVSDIAGETEPAAGKSDSQRTPDQRHNVAPHQIANAAAAAALARAAGVSAEAVRGGLRHFRADPHRLSTVATIGGVRYIDDSKATNPAAAAAALAAFDRVVWVAGGLLKGADVDDLIRGAAHRLHAVILIGHDRALIAAAISRHAPNVPVLELPRPDTGVMDDVVRAAARVACPGGVVLLSPAAASMDMFRDYAERGEEFAAAVQRYQATAQGG